MQEVAVAQRRIGRRCDFLEDVSEDVHFDWKFLGDVNFFKEIKFNYVSLLILTSARFFQTKCTSSDTSSRNSQHLPIRLPGIHSIFRYLVAEEQQRAILSSMVAPISFISSNQFSFWTVVAVRLSLQICALTLCK